MFDMSLLDENHRWAPTDNTFGARLALVRQAEQWNLSEAAEFCNIPEANWREWELNGRTPRNIAEVSLQISDKTAVDDYWLSTGKRNGIFPTTPPKELRLVTFAGKVTPIREAPHKLAA